MEGTGGFPEVAYSFFFPLPFFFFFPGKAIHGPMTSTRIGGDHGRSFKKASLVGGGEEKEWNGSPSRRVNREVNELAATPGSSRE